MREAIRQAGDFPNRKHVSVGLVSQPLVAACFLVEDSLGSGPSDCRLPKGQSTSFSRAGRCYLRVNRSLQKTHEYGLRPESRHREGSVSHQYFSVFSDESMGLRNRTA